MRAPRLSTAVAVAAALVLAGCGGGGDDATAGSASPTSSSAAPGTEDAEATTEQPTAQPTAQPTGPVLEVPAEFGGVQLPLPEGAVVGSEETTGGVYRVQLTGVDGPTAFSFYETELPAAGFTVGLADEASGTLDAEDTDGVTVTLSAAFGQVSLGVRA